MFTIEEKNKLVDKPKGIFSQIKNYEHEQVVFCYDKATGLQSIIAIHDTTLGPALGGTRMWTYKNEEEALYDVLRLSRGMTFKSAISGINLGGGKAVIIGNSSKDKSEALMRRYGKFVDSLNGKYITAEDVGTSTADIEFISMETDYCAGKPEYQGGGGDPSPFTAYGVYLGMKASAKKAWGSESIKGKSVMVQGSGHVGQFLVEHLIEEGAKVFVADINEANIKLVTDKYKVEVVNVNDVYSAEVDIYAPCALGATLNDETIPQLKCDIVAGAANNQLKEEIRHGEMLRDKGILYAPDFLINAGGVINCYAELEGYNRKRAYGYTDKIYQKTLDIYRVAEEENITTHEAAYMEAQRRIDAIALVNSKF
jgi:leucine dehydrogenase